MRHRHVAPTGLSQRTVRRIIAAAAAAAIGAGAIVCPTSACGAAFTWTGGSGSNGNWSADANWLGALPPSTPWSRFASTEVTDGEAKTPVATNRIAVGMTKSFYSACLPLPLPRRKIKNMIGRR